MPIETVDDIVEELMDALGVYGSCVDPFEGKPCKGGKSCRCCASSSLRDRLDAAYEIEGKLKFVMREEVNRG
jgi:hypothetical protein